MYSISDEFCSTCFTNESTSSNTNVATPDWYSIFFSFLFVYLPMTRLSSVKNSSENDVRESNRVYISFDSSKVFDSVIDVGDCNVSSTFSSSISSIFIFILFPFLCRTNVLNNNLKQLRPDEIQVTGDTAKDKLINIISNRLIQVGFVDALVNIQGLSRITGFIYDGWQYGYLFAPTSLGVIYYLQIIEGVISVKMVSMTAV